MKKLLPILFILILSSCSKEVSDYQVVKRNDLIYEVNSKKPFSGRVIDKDYQGHQEISTYKNGIKHGVWKHYHDNEYVEVIYSNGIKSRAVIIRDIDFLVATKD